MKSFATAEFWKEYIPNVFKTRHPTPDTLPPGKTFSADPSHYTDRTGWPVEMAFSTISAAIFTPPVFCSAFCILRAFSR